MIGNSPSVTGRPGTAGGSYEELLVYSQTPSLDQQGNPCPLPPCPGRVTTGVTDALAVGTDAD